MVYFEEFGLLAGAIALGAVHGMEPGHGWPVAASYALDRTNKWVYGFAASFLLGIGHLVSSIAMVGVFFYAKDYFDLTQVNEPITILGGVQIGGPVSLVAGVLLVALGLREYRHSHSHGSFDTNSGDAHDSDAHHDNSNTHDSDSHHDHSHTHDSDSHHDHSHAHDSEAHHDHSHAHEKGHAGDHHDDAGFRSRLRGAIPFVGGHSHSHDDLDDAANRGLLGIAWFAFVLGFAHEEEFEIIGLCAGSNYCLELMSAYAITVVVAIVGLTMVLIAGYQHFEDRVTRYTPYLPVFSAAVLVIMGVGFIAGVF